MAQQKVADDKPLIDRVYDLLLSEKKAKTFYELANAIIGSDLKGNDRDDALARLYTTMNMDGRFLSVGQNFWGLKSWYPVEQHDEEVASKITPKRKRKVVDDDFDDLDDDFDDLDDELDDSDFDDDDLDDDDFDEDDDDEEEVIDEDFDDSDDDDEDEEDEDLDLEDEEDED